MRIQSGDRSAFAGLVERYGVRLRGAAVRVVGDYGVGEDLVQEAFIKVWTHAKQFDPAKASVATWLYRIVVNRAIDYRRRRQPEALPEGFDAPSNEPSALDDLMAQDKRNALSSVLDHLSDKQRAAMVLTYFEERSNAETADIMGLSVKSVESLLVRSRKTLRSVMAAHQKEWMND